MASDVGFHTGPTGSGKSTTLASMLDVINRERDVHIITIEDPIEFYHEHKKSIVTQREVGVDVPSFAEALKKALRQDPDVILVGEMRDLETIGAAVTAADINFMSRYGRGLICMPVSTQQANRLQLKPMVESNQTEYKTNENCES